MRNNPTTRPWWKLGPMAWLGIAILILVNVAVFTDWLTVDRRTVSWIVCSLDPFAWPLWMATLLWCAVLWTAGDRRIGGECFRSVHRFLKPAAVVLGILLLLYQNEAHLATQRTRWYNAVYLEYTVGPLSRLMLDGYWDWKTFVLPVLGVSAIGGLIVFARKMRRMSSEEKEKKSEQLRKNFKVVAVLSGVAVIFYFLPGFLPASVKDEVAVHADSTYRTFLITPVASFLTNGIWDWKLLILPVTGSFLIGGLVILARRLRKRNREGQDD